MMGENYSSSYGELYLVLKRKCLQISLPVMSLPASRCQLVASSSSNLTYSAEAIKEN